MAAPASPPRTLRVKHSATFNGQPLACLENLPGLFADLRPESLRSLAAALVQTAADCEAIHEQGGSLPERREYVW